MSYMRDAIEQLFTEIGVMINGPNPWDITVYNEDFYKNLLIEKNLGLGESYMDFWWDCPQLDEFIYRILKKGLDSEFIGSVKDFIYQIPAYFLNLQTRRRSAIVAEKHYDLDNDWFFSFLDPYKQYSCAYFDRTDDLNEAQQKKLDLICRKAGINSKDQVLDIGCGWGGFARFAAEHYGCNLTGINISSEQIQYARNFCKGLPVKIIHADYRDIRGKFDKIISIGMFEHVGPKNYRKFMKVIFNVLKENGIFILHTIGSNESSLSGDPWLNKYIFPNGKLPSMAQISKAVEGKFVMEDWHNLGPHYDKTLMAWYSNLKNAWDELKNRYDDKFRRMWEYYLLSCAGAFRARRIQLWQIVFTKCGAKQPECRFI